MNLEQRDFLDLAGWRFVMKILKLESIVLLEQSELYLVLSWLP